MASRKSGNPTGNQQQQQQKIEDDFAVLAARFNTLGADCRLSFLEIKLYKKYFVETVPKTQEKLNRLKLIVETLEKHRKNTINVLKTIHERDAIMDAVHGQIERISSSSNRNASILDFQSDGLHLIYLHQQVTLRVVEAVENWRRPLTRPFPFIHQGENYFAKVLADTTEISTSSLGKILPVKLNQYPLCSDLPSLCLFATPNPAKAAAGGSGGGGGAGKQPTSRMTSEMTQKINSAQAILLEEIDTQKRLLRELEGLSTAGFFLPVLNLHSIIPSCSTGIRMSNHEWEEQLREAIAEAKDDLDSAEERAHNPTTGASTSLSNNNNTTASNKKNSGSHRNGATNHPGGSSGNNNNNNTKKQDYADDFSDASSSSSSSISSNSSRASSASPDEKKRKKEETTSSAAAAATGTAAAQRKVSIDDKPRNGTGSAGTGPSHQPQPPPRPTSAKKRSETPTNPAPAAPVPPKTGDTANKGDDDDDGFEKESSSSSSDEEE